MRKLVIVLIVLLAVFPVFSNGQQEKKAESDFAVGFVFTGPIGDNGWTQQHNYGRLAVEKQLGVRTLYKENVPNTQESAKVMRDMIAQGAKMIFATSFGYMDYMMEVAAEHPEVKFFHAGGYLQTDNAVNYFGRMYQARYLSGIVAGMKTQTKKLGFVAAFEIPEVVRGINAFTLGARSVDPSITVEVIWTHNWNDPPREKEAANALIDNGCDVIAQHQTAPANLQAAEARGVWGVGYHADMNNAAPEACLTSPYWNWEPYYVREVKAVMDGTWKAVNYWGGMEDDTVRLAALGKNAPAGAAEAVAKAKDAIIGGRLEVFAGPLKDNTGKLMVPAGSKMTDGELLSMAWLVEGVIGSIN
ncbi:MAG: BMP family ABC transporter substrate-binding protein [Sphaerochaetaceae bacterium]